MYGINCCFLISLIVVHIMLSIVFKFNNILLINYLGIISIVKIMLKRSLITLE